MTTVRWGTLGVAKIATAQVIPAMRQLCSGRMVAIASRDLSKAHAAAETLGVDRAYGSYEALLADPAIDAVYIALPNRLHVPWALLALDAGKHVLCEKPIGLDADDALRLSATAARYPQLKLMEAFMYRFHPQWQAAHALVRAGAIGAVRSVHTAFAYFNTQPENIRNQAGLGGGALMDIGCYGISVARWIFGAEPTRVVGASACDPRFETDRLTSGVLEFEQGIATFTCGTQMAPHQRVEIAGATGRLVVHVPFNPPPAQPTTVSVVRDGNEEALTFAPANQFALEVEAFSQAVLNDAPVPTPIEDGVANMRVIDTVRRVAAAGRVPISIAR